MCDLDQNSPLHVWAKFSCNNTGGNSSKVKEFGQVLLNYGALVNLKNNSDQIPLHVASSWEAVNLLLDNGTYPNVQDMFSGDTPLLCRVKSLKKSSRSVYDGFTTKAQCHNDAVQEWHEVIKKGMDPWIANHKGETVLQILLEKRNFILAKAIITVFKENKQLDNKHTNGDTVLHILCKRLGIDECLDIINDVLAFGVSVNAGNSSGDTPLSLVCKELSILRESLHDVEGTVYVWTARRLMAYGADPSLPKKVGASCFDVAKDVPQLRKLLETPIDISAITPLLKWADPKSVNHKNKIAQVIRNYKSNQIEHYHYHQEPIGSGAFGYVHAGVNSKNGIEVAVKKIMKQKLVRPEDRREIKQLINLRDCTVIVRYLDHHEDEHFVYLILELMEGTLDEYLENDSRDASLDRHLSHDVVNGLHYLHRNNVLHRDIKPGNILYKTSPRICLKLADFGLSTKSDFNTSSTLTVMHSKAGTRCWMCPELLRSTERFEHQEASDVFACGLLIHYLLSEKQHPFAPSSTTSKSTMALQNETERNILEYKLNLCSEISLEAKHMVERMLLEDPKKRCSAADILSHPFFWSKAKMIQFLVAVGDQPEFEMPRRLVTTHSKVEQELEITLCKDFAISSSLSWDNKKNINIVYNEMTSKRGHIRPRLYVTTSAVELVRFVRNTYAHSEGLSPPVQDLLFKDFIFLREFPSMLIEVYKATTAHGWNSRPKIEEALKLSDSC